MGYFGKLKEKQKVQKLRSQGLSYKEILQQVTVSKDSVSRWCRGIVLTKEQELRLTQSKDNGQHKGFLTAARNRKIIKLKQLSDWQLIGEKEIGILSDRDKFITGIVLYAGEGTKMDGKGGFTNSDPKLLKFMRYWLVDYAKIEIKNLRGRIWIHEELDENKAKKYWSEILDIPKSQFIRSYISKRKNSGRKITKNLHNFGVCAIVFYDTSAHRRIMSWISALFNDKMST